MYPPYTEYLRGFKALMMKTFSKLSIIREKNANWRTWTVSRPIILWKKVPRKNWIMRMMVTANETVEAAFAASRVPRDCTIKAALSPSNLMVRKSSDGLAMIFGTVVFEAETLSSYEEPGWSADDCTGCVLMNDNVALTAKSSRVSE